MTGSVEMVKARENETSPSVASTNDESLAEERSEVGFMATETKTLPEIKDPEGADEGTEVKLDVDKTNGVEKLEVPPESLCVENGITNCQQGPSTARGGGGRGGKGSRSRGRGGKAISSSRGRPYSPTAEDYVQMRSLHSTVPHGAVSSLDEDDIIRNPGPTIPLDSTTPQYLSREAILQLSACINNGLVWLSHSYEMTRQGQLELQRARDLMDSICQAQGIFNPINNLPNADSIAEENAYSNSSSPINRSERVVDADAAAQSWNNDMKRVTETEIFRNVIDDVINSSVEEMQLPVNPFQYMENDFPLKSDQSQTITSKVGKARRGRGGGTGNTGRRKRGGGALLHSKGKRTSKQFPCSYGADKARNGFEGLYNNYLSGIASNDKALEKESFMTVTVRDIGPLLTEEHQLAPKVFSASKVESSLREANSDEDGVILELNPGNETDSDSDDLFEVSNSKKIVRKNTKPPLDENMTDSGRSKRKLPSRSVDSEEDTLPRWRHLRVDDDVKKRILSRVFKGREVWSTNNQVKNTNDNEDDTSDVGSDRTEIIPGRSSPNHETDKMERSTDDNNNSNQNPKKRTNFKDDLRSGDETDDYNMKDHKELVKTEAIMFMQIKDEENQDRENCFDFE